MSIATLAEQIRAGQLRALAKGITLIESRRIEHRQQADALLETLLPATGNSLRIGISGVPGVGKSTFIEAFGLYLTARGHRVAVLAVDPSSQISGGSILGDKTRMEQLARDANAFIRPSPAGDSLGGVARKTRETLLLCEAAGYDIVLVETVGVGQSEITVASMVDMFVLLQLAGAGDELQGIKKGVMEIADAIVINKADGDNRQRAELARQQYRNALHILRPRYPDWQVPVLCCSALQQQGIAEFWQMLQQFRQQMQANGTFSEKRRQQARDWLWALLLDALKELFLHDRQVAALLPQVEQAVVAGITTPGAACQRLLERFRRH
ncbi:methylmalonyl Co-A mutase-associated GTPase MeaB [Desulfuromonas thiophila]|jgi:LAO/AO transport system kinase|uniref:Methylmalonyl-CoA mutase metallochaperone MeaB n=1 Tax=Desulfuromonas thiophila TaxID=57664 RepID=A0A1G7CRH9_9BACT|nr:methylmalonyl Co-A mutase-associated GTPase MeaB [Desulfuromonas thiophila]MCK9173235.1 methylmalonyl Co-A mutase-associated GTPase MeaB [Desulfuromonas thiophila]SDE41266.1 methylmalonyl-CoA mutase metallochaperone MeaB [Desulfuromonas thiophila]